MNKQPGESFLRKAIKAVSPKPFQWKPSLKQEEQKDRRTLLPEGKEDDSPEKGMVEASPKDMSPRKLETKSDDMPRVRFRELTGLTPEKLDKFSDPTLPAAPQPPSIEFLYPSVMFGNRSQDSPVTRFASKAELSPLIKSSSLLVENTSQAILYSSPPLTKAISSTEMLWMAEMLAQNLRKAKIALPKA